jgi:AraC-like DNA-binding protein
VPTKPYWPRPAIALAFYPRDREWVRSFGDRTPVRKPRVALIGQPTLLTSRTGGHDFSVYQIELAPGALHRLTGLPADRLTDAHVDAEAVFPSGIRALADAITDVDDPDTMIELAERYLLAIDRRARRASARAFAWAAEQLAGERPPPIDLLAGRIGVTPRHLHRLFLEQAGVSPRSFGRIARFDRTVRLSNRQSPESLWAMAIDAGYHDYQHMKRDFLAFTGMRPAQFMAIESEAPERLFGRAEQ